ncbi:MAG: hypothetical protein PHI98_03255, partial [Eubacteriales bacterium]|nr:hypothetical protein [Eubacteriales bacterium]
MLDIRRIRQNPQELIDALKARNKDISLDDFLAKDTIASTQNEPVAIIEQTTTNEDLNKSEIV